MEIIIDEMRWLASLEKRGDAGCWLTQECGWPYATLSCWPEDYQLKGVSLKPGHFWLKSWGENRQIVSLMREHGYLEYTGVQCPLSPHAIAYEVRLITPRNNA